MTEAQLMESVRSMCADLGLLAYHGYDSRRSWGTGFPDLVILGPRGLLFRECKTQSGQTSHDQRVWGYRLAEAGYDWAIWRPSDLKPARGRPPLIVAELCRIAGRRAAVPA